MKKYFLVILLVGIFGVSFAQETNNFWTSAENYVQPGETKIITQDLNSDNMADLQNIQARFCNNEKVTKDLELYMRPWQRKDICVALVNKSDKPIGILFWFSKGMIKDWAPTCDSDMTDKNEFSKHILQNTTTGIMVPASGTVIQNFKYSAPNNLSWRTLGCVGYEINKQEQIESGKMFLIVPRKVGYIYILMLLDLYINSDDEMISKTYIPPINLSSSKSLSLY